jgi:hypothetical protein
MATCACVGQAAGTAAAMCIERGIIPRQIHKDGKLLAKLQQDLLRDDQTIRGRTNQDAADLARKATVRASGHFRTARPELVIDGHTRDYPPGKSAPARHQWIARLEDDGAWIELAWDQPQRIRHVQITFDSGFQRELTLTASDRINDGIVRAPQPETVRDYTITARDTNGAERELTRVEGNHQRLNRHRIDPVEARSLRIHVTATNGDRYARIFEVRCYG